MPWKALKTAAGSGWKEIDRAAGSGWKELLWDVANIDVGAPAIEGTTYTTTSLTYLSLTNPCNDNGVLDKLDIYIHSAYDGCCRVGTVFLVSGTTYECRDAEDISGLSNGLNSDVPISLNVETGDFIAVSRTGGESHFRLIGFAGGGRTYNGDALVISSQFDYATAHNYKISLYASNY